MFTVLSMHKRRDREDMKRQTKTLTSILLALSASLLLFSNLGWAADDKDQSEVQKRIRNAADVLNEIMAVKDKAVPDKIMADAECIALVPSMVKTAIGFSGNQRKGRTTRRTAQTRAA